MSRAGLAALLLALPAAALAAEGADDPSSLPQGRGLPVIVRSALTYVDVLAFEENEGSFEAVVDLRLRWTDDRLRFPKEDAPRGFKELAGEEAEAKLAEIWHPLVSLANARDDEPPERGLRLFPDGSVEVMERHQSTFRTPVDMRDFPFDDQRLVVEVACDSDSMDDVRLEFRQDDLDFSRALYQVHVEGWRAGLVDVQRDPEEGWYGRRHARLVFGLELARVPGFALAPIFIPLLASLLIPLLAIWMNRVDEGTFTIEAFELTNVVIGGLFAVIALNFTVAAEYKEIAGGDNTVTRLFGLNYLCLGISLVVNVVMFRFNILRRVLGKYVQEQAYLFLVWAVPLMAFATSGAILLAAVA